MATYIVTYRHHCEDPEARPAPHSLILDTNPEFAHAAAERAVTARHGHGVYDVVDVVPVPRVGDGVHVHVLDHASRTHTLTGTLVRVWPSEPAAGGGRVRFVSVVIDGASVPESLTDWYAHGRPTVMSQDRARPIPVEADALV